MQGLLSNTQKTQLQKRYIAKFEGLGWLPLTVKKENETIIIGFPCHSSGNCLGATEHL